jgi:CRP-like cAMP-binding protein
LRTPRKRVRIRRFDLKSAKRGIDKQKEKSMQQHQPQRLPAAAYARANGSDGKPAASQRADLVQQFPLFSSISSTDCGEIVSAAHEKKFLCRQTIFVEGDPVREVLLLTAGCVKITQVGQNGCEVILRLEGAGELVVSPGFRSGCNHCATACAIQPSTGLVWDALVFESISERFPILRRNSASILGECLLEMEERFREISTEKVGPRLSHELVRLLYQVGRRVNGSVEIGLSRQELAQMTGTTLFTVSRLLSQWGKLGIVSTRRGAVMVCNLQALRELAEVE